MYKEQIKGTTLKIGWEKWASTWKLIHWSNQKRSQFLDSPKQFYRENIFKALLFLNMAKKFSHSYY